MQRLAVFCALFGLVAVPAVASAEDATVVIHHQGRLLDETDRPQTGPLRVRAKLWVSREATAPVWSEEYDVVLDPAGQYAVPLGDPRLGKPLTANDVVGERWFSITIDGTELLPRFQLGGVPSALQAANALALGGVPAADYLQRAEFDALKQAVTVEGPSGLTVPWAALSDVPPLLQVVEVEQGLLTGDGTAARPLRIAGGAVTTPFLADLSVTTDKIAAGGVTTDRLAPNAVTTDRLAAGAVTLDKIAGCAAGQVLKHDGTSWQCGADVGSGSTLPFEVVAPLEQVAGSDGAPAALRLRDGGIDTMKLADDAVDAQKLGADAASLGKITSNALVATGDGAVGVGSLSPTARLEVADYPAAGSPGPGTASYLSGRLTVTLSGGSVEGVLRPGDSLQLGTLGWRTVASVESPTSIVLSASYASAFSGAWTYRRATLRSSALVQTATGELGVGTAAPSAKVDVAGNVNVSGTFTVNGVSAVVPPGAVMHFATPNCPAGWVKANGQTLHSDDYPALAAAFGATGTFAVPDLRGEFVRGVDDGRGVDPGRTVSSGQGQDFKSFTAWNADPGAYNHGPVYFGKSGRTGNLFGGHWAAPAGRISVQWDGSEVRPRNVALLACIKH